jgi:hypothetical protein
MKLSRVISRVRWFNFVETNVSKTISALVLRVVEINSNKFYDPEDEDRDGLRNVGLYKTEPPQPADNPRKLHYTPLDL